MYLHTQCTTVKLLFLGCPMPTPIPFTLQSYKRLPYPDFSHLAEWRWQLHWVTKDPQCVLPFHWRGFPVCCPVSCHWFTPPVCSPWLVYLPSLSPALLHSGHFLLQVKGELKQGEVKLNLQPWYCILPLSWLSCVASLPLYWKLTPWLGSVNTEIEILPLPPPFMNSESSVKDFTFKT